MMMPKKSGSPGAGVEGFGTTGVGVAEMRRSNTGSVLSAWHDETVPSQVMTEVRVGGDVVDTALSPGVAAQESASGEEGALEDAVLLDGADRIRGA